MNRGDFNILSLPSVVAAPAKHLGLIPAACDMALSCYAFPALQGQGKTVHRLIETRLLRDGKHWNFREYWFDPIH